MGICNPAPLAPGGGGGGGPHEPNPAGGYRGGTPPLYWEGGIPEYGGGAFGSEDDPAVGSPPLYDPREDGGGYCD
jgi:hypothetical protein